MNRPVLFVLLLLFWILLTWRAEGPGPAYPQEIGVGAVVAALAAWLLGRKGAAGAARWLEPRRYVFALAYLFVLGLYVVKANFEVAYRVLHPKLPIAPGIVRVKTRLTRASARTLLGNSITLCPGTLTVELEEDGTLFVHQIVVRSVEPEEAGREIVDRFEWFIHRILE